MIQPCNKVDFFKLINLSHSRYQTSMAKAVLDTIVSIQPKDSTAAGSGETRESIVKRQAEDMLDRLPVDYVPHEVSLCS